MSKEKKKNSYDRDVPYEGEVMIGAQDYNPVTRNVKLPLETLHSYQNYHKIVNDFKTGKGIDAGMLKLKKPEPIIIIGSGPTFDDYAPYLKEWKGAIMPSSSQGITCVYYGKDPTYIIVLDPNTEWKEFERIDTWEGRDCKLITHPCNHPDLAEKWPNQTMYFRCMEPNTPFHAQTMTMIYNQWIKTSCLLFSCALSAQVAVAHMLGYDPIYTIGADFGYNRVDEKSEYRERFTEYYYHELEGWKTDGPQFIKDNKEIIAPEISTQYLIAADSHELSVSLHIYYKRAFYCVLRMDRSNVFRVGEKGTLIELPYIGIDELIETQGKIDTQRYWSDAKKIKAMDGYLARFHTYAICYKTGELAYFECKENLKPYFNSLPLDIQQRITAGEEIDVPKQINRFIDSTFKGLKTIAPKLNKKPEDMLDVKAEKARLRRLYERGKKLRLAHRHHGDGYFQSHLSNGKETEKV